MTYDPFARGPHPVGVQTRALYDASRASRRVEVELWYPATQAHAGQDVSPQAQDRYSLYGAANLVQEAVRDAVPASGAFPMVVFSHGMAGHRRQSTFVCTHLASHGYVVASPDHGGNSLADLMALAMRIRDKQLPAEIEAVIQGYVFDRPADMVLLLDARDDGRLALPNIATSAAAAAGHSFGGFTALVVAARDERVTSVLALAPAGGPGPLSSSALASQLALDFGGRKVDTLYLALAKDSLLPLSGIEDLFQRTSEPSRMFTLPDADHMHFCDRAQASHEFFRNMPRLGIFGDLLAEIPAFSSLAAAAVGEAFANALGLAHVDASLKGISDARAFLDGAVAAFAARGITIQPVTRLHHNSIA
jgi:pimeloyl-ACP methyl ester carboxylesterase